MKTVLLFGVAIAGASSVSCAGSQKSDAASVTAAPSAAPSGRLPPEVIQRIVRASASSFEECYNEARKRDPTIRGRTSTRILIDRTGHVSISSDLGVEGTLPADVGKCVAERFAKLEFPPSGEDKVTVVYPLVFGNYESQNAGNAPRDDNSGLGGGVFDKGAAAKVLNDAAVSSRTCVKPNGPTGAGHIKVTFDLSGHVIATELDSGPFAGTSVGTCISAHFHEAHIPAFSGSPVTVGKSLDIR